MNGLAADADELDRMMAAGGCAAHADLLICPPATLIAAFSTRVRGTSVAIGGQDCHPEQAGAFTGDISAEMLKDAGATAVIVGHSERRAAYHEGNALVRAKAAAAARAGLTAIICIGESKDQRTAGHAVEVVLGQLDGSLPDNATGPGLVVAYEPVWAIGTGLTPTPADVAEMHRAIRIGLRKRYGDLGGAVRVLYGGSVKPSNAKELLSIDDVDGALVGGASLKARDFLEIAAFYLSRA
jgi:triosephosphate isomerase